MTYPLTPISGAPVSGTPVSGREDADQLWPRRSSQPRPFRQRCRPVSVTLFTQPDPDAIRDWDRLVGDTPYSDVTQLSAWSSLRRHAGFLPVYLLARRDDRLVGGALLLQRQLPVLGVVAYLPYGPVIAAGQPRAAVARAVSAAVADLGHRYLHGVFVQPPEGADDISEQLVARGFRPSAAGIAPQASIRIDLTRAVADLFAGLNKSNRRLVRTAAERGVTVRLGGARDLPVVAELLARTAAQQRFVPLSLPYLRTMYRELTVGDHLSCFIAELDGVPVAAEVFTGCGGVLKARLTGVERSGRARRSGAAAVLEWHAILWAKAHDYHTFDFGGLLPEAVDTIAVGRADLAAHLTGPDYFKASFGGQPFRYPAPVELISSPLLRIGYDLSRRSTTGGRLVTTAKRFMRNGTT